MGNILIWLILLVTIPRWAMTLQQVDTYQAFGIPITAVGEGIVLELGCWFIIQVYSDARKWALKYRADWEAHDERMQEQGKRNRKDKHEPHLRGYKVLMTAFVGLLFITLLAQTPFIMTQFLPGETIASILTDRRTLWGYSVVLVIAPEIMTAAVALANHYRRMVLQIEGATSFLDAVTAAMKLRIAALFEGLTAPQRQKQQEPQQKPEQPREVATVVLIKQHFDEWIASHNGTSATLKRDDALEWASDAGVDISTATGKRDRDKVLRWWRSYMDKLQQSAQPAPAPQQQQQRAAGEGEEER